MSYKAFLRSLFGSHYTLHLSTLRGLQLYGLFLVTFVLSLCVYTLRRTRYEYDRNFEERVHTLRAQYATAQRTGYD